MATSAPTRMSRQLTGGHVQEGALLAAPCAAGAESDSDEIKEEKAVNVCMIGTGEYTTGYVHGGASDSDKGAGGEVFLMDQGVVLVSSVRCVEFPSPLKSRNPTSATSDTDSSFLLCTTSHTLFS